MNSKRIIGIVLMVIGVVLFIFSTTISNRVAEGRGEISSAQGKVDTGKSLFSMHPATKEAGGIFTDSAQKRIDAGTHEANYYERMANWLKISGVVVFILGIGCVALGRNKRD